MHARATSAHLETEKCEPGLNVNGSFRFPETSLDFSLARAKQAVAFSLACSPTKRQFQKIVEKPRGPHQ